MARILLVEDNDLNRDMLSRRLQRKGHEVLMAADGMQGLLMAESETPDLVLLDMSLPSGSGLELLGRLRADERSRRVPVVALTAHAMRGDRERFLAAGCDGYISKPIESGAFLAAVASFLGPRSQGEGVER